jgi:hypothetical protein
MFVRFDNHQVIGVVHPASSSKLGRMHKRQSLFQVIETTNRSAKSLPPLGGKWKDLVDAASSLLHDTCANTTAFRRERLHSQAMRTGNQGNKGLISGDSMRRIDG